MNPNYTKIYCSFIKCRELTVMEKIVYICIKSYAYKGICFPSVNSIAENCGICPRTAHRAIKVLREKGFINVQNRVTPYGGKTSNLYTVSEEREKSPV